MKTYTIYKATNPITGKSYIGFDSKWPSRQKEHKRNSENNRFTTNHFHCAIRKYGFENFAWSVLYTGNDSNHTLNIMEPFYIKKYKTFLGEGYNMTPGGDGCVEHTPEALLKITKASTGKTRKHSIETKIKMSISAKGRVLSEEQKRKMSEAQRGKVLPEEQRRKMSLSRKGKIHNEESKEKMSKARQGRKRIYREDGTYYISQRNLPSRV